MVVNDVLAEMDEEKEQRQASVGTFKFVFLTLSVGPKKNGGTATVGQKTSFRPLYALDQALLMLVHSIYDGATKVYTKAICAKEIGKPCHFCKLAETETDKKRKRELEAKKSLMLPTWMYGIKDQFEKDGPWVALTTKDENGVEKNINGMRILELQNFGAIEPVYKAIRRVHSGDSDEGIAPRDIRSMDFVVECHGVQQEKKLTPDRRDPSPMHPEVKDAIPTREAVREMILDARPPKVIGETAAPASAPAAQPAKGNVGDFEF